MLEARAYNNSIYLMVATPYALLGLSGLVFFGMVVKARITLAGGIASLVRDQLSKGPPDPTPPSSSE